MKQRKLVIGLLIILAVAVSGFTFAFWADSVAGGTSAVDGSILIGEGEAVTTTFVVTDNANSSSLPLVPTAYVESGVTINAITLNFSVEWDAVEAGAAGVTSTLTVTGLTFGGLTLPSGTNYTDLFSLNVANNDTFTITEGVALPIAITVTFYAEPANQAVYEAVANGTLTLDATFTVSAITTA